MPAMALGDRLWIPHEDLVWAPGTLVGSDSTHLEFRITVATGKQAEGISSGPLEFTFEREDQSRVNVSFANQPLGIEFRNSLPVTVKSVVADSKAESQGVQVGWGVSAVNGSDVSNKTLEEVKQFLVSSAARLPPEKHEAVRVERSQQPTLQRVIDEQLEGIDNIVDLEEVNHAAVLATVRKRYLRQPRPFIYTRVSRILIAVNPFQNLPIYGMQTMKEYLESADSMQCAPHVFAVAADAVKGLRLHGQNQAVLISGESGAGKTESTKLVLSFASEALSGRGKTANNSSSSVADRVMQTNPIMEAFGNAMTVRNNNSSRFGKWLQMEVGGGDVKGSNITDYLLELTRVVRQGAGERNYHIFFQLLTDQELGMQPPEHYRYLKDAQFKAPGIDDRACFEELKEALHALNFTADAQREIFDIVIGILTLGNTGFDSDGDLAAPGSVLQDEAPVRKAASLLGLDFDELKQALTVKSLQLGKDWTESPRDPEAAEAVRDSIARLIYGRLFKHIVERINTQLHLAEGGSTKFFGVLDIAGFESFETNSLEQLSINLSNEHLQQHFNSHVFKLELADYKAEGVELAGGLDFHDNSDIIALLDAKGSLLSLLDEEVYIPKATDVTLVTKFVKYHGKHPRFIPAKFANGVEFGVRHFARDVHYSADGWLEKNVDAPPSEAPKLFSASTNQMLSVIGGVLRAEQDEASSQSRATGRGKKVVTVSGQFRTQLADLVRKLAEAEPHFIRCIKPNEEKVAGKFTSSLVVEQLSACGVFEAVKIRQCGFASRIPFDEFFGRYRIVLPRALQQQIYGRLSGRDKAANMRIFLGALPAALRLIGAEFAETEAVVGKTKLFARARLVQNLDTLRDLSTADYAMDIQRVWRGYVVRKMVKESVDLFAEVKAWVDANNFYNRKRTAYSKYEIVENMVKQINFVDILLKKSQRSPLMCPQRRPAEAIKNRMIQEVEMMRYLPALMKSIDPFEIEKALSRAQDLKLEVLPAVATLRERASKLKVQVPIVKAMQEAIEGNDVEDMTAVMGLVKKQKLHTSPEGWIAELNGTSLASDFFQAIEQQRAAQKMTHMKKEMNAQIAARVGRGELAVPFDDMLIVESESSIAERKRLREEKEAKKQARRKERATLAGASESEVKEVLESLAEAMEAFDVDNIETQLKLVLEKGMDQEQDLVKDAEDLFVKLSQRDFILKAMWDHEEMLKKDMKNREALKILQNLLAQAQKVGIEEMQVQETKKMIRDGVRQRARLTINGSIFENVNNMADLILAESAFANLFNFPNLKKPEEWEGHAAKYFFGWGKSGKDIMLRWDKHDLVGSLTKLPTTYNQRPIVNFTNLVQWMGDRPVPETQRAYLAEDIVNCAGSSFRMADEVYMQLMKQLARNPGKRSIVRGWELMLMLCQQAAPTPELHEFLHVFLLQNIAKADEELKPSIRQCIADLNVTASSERAKRDENSILVMVQMIDFSTRKVRIPGSASLKQLGDILAERMRIVASKDFGFFMRTEGLHQQRMLPETAVVSDLLAKWAVLKERTNKRVTLVYKRKIMLRDEVLKTGDPQHATLTYQQAVADFLRYPVTEKSEDFIKVAAAMLWTDRDFWAKVQKKGKLGSEGNLEQLLPKIYLRDRQRSAVVEKLEKAFIQLEREADPAERRRVSMSRVFSDMQKLRLFGAYLWHGKQVDLAEADLPIADSPETKYCINPQDPKAEYFVCVNWTGVHFVAQGSGGRLFSRSFHFSEEMTERVLYWGSNSDKFQLIISTVDPTEPAKGRYPMTMVIQTPAAVDIGFALHMIHMTKSGKEV